MTVRIGIARPAWPSRLAAMGLCALLTACVTPRAALPPAAAPAWEQRAAQLQRTTSWQLDGRAAVAVGDQGWQATLNWHQFDGRAELHLAGPLGVGALALSQTAAGISVNGAPPSAAVSAQLQDKLGFELPLEGLRYWALGVPQPGTPNDVTRNASDRAQQLVQDGWTVAYDKYMPVAGDVLPSRFVMTREGVRVRIAVDHWQLSP